MKRGFGTIASALYLATASPAFAHHSHPLTYDWCKSITVEGRVDSVEFKNPHSIVVVRQDDGTAYTVDWMPVANLTRNGIAGIANIPGVNQVLSENTRMRTSSSTLVVIKPTITRLPMSDTVTPQYLLGPVRGERVIL